MHLESQEQPRSDGYSPDWDATWNRPEPVPLDTNAHCSNCTWCCDRTEMCRTIPFCVERCGPLPVERRCVRHHWRASEETAIRDRAHSWQPETSSRNEILTEAVYIREVLFTLASAGDLCMHTLMSEAGIQSGRARDWLFRMRKQGLICEIGKRKISNYPGPPQKLYGKAA